MKQTEKESEIKTNGFFGGMIIGLMIGILVGLLIAVIHIHGGIGCFTEGKSLCYLLK